MSSVKTIIASISLLLFSVTFLDSLSSFTNLINPGINYIYIFGGTEIAPNLVTNIVFDWRGYDTLGEALILVTAVITTLLIFGKGKTKMGGNK